MILQGLEVHTAQVHITHNTSYLAERQVAAETCRNVLKHAGCITHSNGSASLPERLLNTAVVDPRDLPQDDGNRNFEG